MPNGPEAFEDKIGPPFYWPAFLLGRDQMLYSATSVLAGGETGVKHFMSQFGPALEWPWTKLMDVLEFAVKLVALFTGQSKTMSLHMDLNIWPTSFASKTVSDRPDAFSDSDTGMPKPDGAGRHGGQ